MIRMSKELCIDLIFGDTAPEGYWTTTIKIATDISDVSQINAVWYVNFGNGNVAYSHVLEYLHVRAVRGGR
jgi:hypothetical protein